MTDGDDTIYIVEAEQAGLFNIKGFTDEQLPQILNTTCPGILFPYLRETLDNIVTKGSFPALLLPPINFDALFANAVQQAAEENQGTEEAVRAVRRTSFHCTLHNSFLRSFLFALFRRPTKPILSRRLPAAAVAGVAHGVAESCGFVEFCANV